MSCAIFVFFAACSDSEGSPTGPRENATAALEIFFEAEQQEDWSVVAVTKMLLDFYGHPETQCSLASLFWSGYTENESCCVASSECPGDWSIWGVKNTLDFYGIPSLNTDLPLSLEDVKAEIRLGSPVVIHLYGEPWGRSALIYGFTSNDRILIHDPKYGSIVVAYPDVPRFQPVDLGYAPDSVWRDTLWGVGR